MTKRKFTTTYAFAKDAVWTYLSTVPRCWEIAQILYKVNVSYIITLFLRDQERWNLFKKTMKCIKSCINAFLVDRLLKQGRFKVLRDSVIWQMYWKYGVRPPRWRQWTDLEQKEWLQEWSGLREKILDKKPWFRKNDSSTNRSKCGTNKANCEV